MDARQVRTYFQESMCILLAVIYLFTNEPVHLSCIGPNLSQSYNACCIFELQSEAMN